jgi:hypothetical protein
MRSEAKTRNPTEKLLNKAKKALVGRVTQVAEHLPSNQQGPEFKPQYHQKAKKQGLSPGGGRRAGNVTQGSPLPRQTHLASHLIFPNT